MWQGTLSALIWAILFASLHKVTSNSLVDLNGPGCDELDGYTLRNSEEIITLFAIPQYNIVPTRDDCYVTVRALEGRRIQYLIETIDFKECGITITIYDNPTSDTNPIHVISCSSEGRPVVPFLAKTRSNIMRVYVRKTTAESRIFDFTMKLKDDRGTSIQFEGDSSNYVGEALDPGVIAGIGIAGGIIIIALILLAIYLCLRARQASGKETASSTHGESSVYTSGNSQVIFPSGSPRYPKGRYGSMEDIRSTTSSQDKTNGSYANPAYTAGPGEKRSERSASVGRSRGKTGFANKGFDDDPDSGRQRGDNSWEERESPQITRGGSERLSRKDAFDNKEKKQLKSAMKKRDPPTDMEMNKVNTQPLNGILKTRPHSPSRSQTSSTEGSFDPNTMVYGYKHSNIDHPNVHHKPVLERRRSRSGTRSHHSTSSAGRPSSRDRRSQSADKKKPKPNSRMYNTEVFIDDRSRRRSGSRSRTRSNSLRSKRSDRTSDSVDSESSATSQSRKVSMNPGGKRVHIKGEETDI